MAFTQLPCHQLQAGNLVKMRVLSNQCSLQSSTHKRRVRVMVDSVPCLILNQI